jgi:hypothetical protein
MMVFLSGNKFVLFSNKTLDYIIDRLFSFSPDLFGRDAGDRMRHYYQPQRSHPPGGGYRLCQAVKGIATYRDGWFTFLFQFG